MIHDQKGQWGLIGLLLAVALICGLFFLMSKVYFGENGGAMTTSVNFGGDNQKALADQGTDTRTPQSTLQGMTKQIQDINKQTNERSENFTKDVMGQYK